MSFASPPPQAPIMPISDDLLKMSQTSPMQAAALGTPEASLINPQTGALNFNQYTGAILGGTTSTDNTTTVSNKQNKPKKARPLGGLAPLDDGQFS